MNKLKRLIYLFITVILFSCAKEQKKDYLKFSENILDYSVTPKGKFDKYGLMFSDQGAWFAYSFPDTISNFGGFSGPFLMTQQNGVWSSSSLTQINLKNIEWISSETKSYNSHYLSPSSSGIYT